MPGTTVLYAIGNTNTSFPFYVYGIILFGVLSCFLNEVVYAFLAKRALAIESGQLSGLFLMVNNECVGHTVKHWLYSLKRLAHSLLSVLPLRYSTLA